MDVPSRSFPVPSRHTNISSYGRVRDFLRWRWGQACVWKTPVGKRLRGPRVPAPVDAAGACRACTTCVPMRHISRSFPTHKHFVLRSRARFPTLALGPWRVCGKRLCGKRLRGPRVPAPVDTAGACRACTTCVPMRHMARLNSNPSRSFPTHKHFVLRSRARFPTLALGPWRVCGKRLWGKRLRGPRVPALVDTAGACRACTTCVPMRHMARTGRSALRQMACKRRADLPQPCGAAGVRGVQCPIGAGLVPGLVPARLGCIVPPRLGTTGAHKGRPCGCLVPTCGEHVGSLTI